jgi:16S rRNA (cytosine967-C5)-methyltransferase
MISYRYHAIKILDRFYETSQNLKSIQNKYFVKFNISKDDRNRIVALTREILRWKGRIDWYIALYLNSPFNKIQSILLAILELGTYEIIFDDKVPNYAAINSTVEIAKSKINIKAGGLVNAVLRKISSGTIKSKPQMIENYQWESYPEWLYNKWTKEFGVEDTFKLANYFNKPTNLVIRRNNSIITKNKFEEILSGNLEIEIFNNSDRFYKVKRGGSILKHHGSFKRGEFSFQDRASGMIVELLDPQPGEVVLDVCAAPGTKTNYIAELVNSNITIYASDVDENRIELAKNDSKRTRNTSIIFEVKNAITSEFPMADKVLIDAPCTGTGTIGRRPDLKWRRSPDQLRRAVKLQKAILNNIQKFVKPGGFIIYATCSLEREENWDVVEAFLKFHDEFKVVAIDNKEIEKFTDERGALNIFPPNDQMDGMFAVKMIKNV